MITTPRDVITDRYHFVDRILREPDTDCDAWILSEIRKRFSETAEAEAERVVKERKAEEEKRWITLVQEKWVECDVYSGPITIKIRSEFHAPDLYVHFDDNCVPFDGDFEFEENLDWKEVIIGVLQDAGFLDSDRIFSMWSAESGMQGSDYFAYEGIEDQVTGEWISRELFLEWGAKDLANEQEDV